MRSRSNYHSSQQTQTKITFEPPPRYRRYSGPGLNKICRLNDYNQGVRYQIQREKVDFTQNQHQNQNQNKNRSNVNTLNINDNKSNHHKYKPNINEDTKASMPNKNENDRERERERQRPQSQHSHKSYESETKWDNDRHQHQDQDQDKENKNSNTKNNNQNISDNNYHRNRNRICDRGNKEEHTYDQDVANSDYHELEKWNHDYDIDVNESRNYPYHKQNPSNQNGYDRDYDDYDRRNNSRRRSGSFQRRDRYKAYSRGHDLYRERERGINNTDSSIVCKFYNPYFKTGCKKERCPFAHLKPDELLIYCKFIRKQNGIDSYSQRKFDDALAYIKRGLTNKAFYIFRDLVRKYEYDAHCNFWLGRCYALFNEKLFDDLDCAKYYYQKAISLRPDNASFHAYYAEFMVELGRMKKAEIESYEYKQAKTHCLKAIELKPLARFYLQYAKLLDETEGEFFEAKKYYKLALKTYGSDTRIRLNYARLLHKMGNLRASKQEFLMIFSDATEYRQYKTLSTRWLWPHFHYARLLVDMQYYESAKREFEICIEIQEHHNHKFFSEIYYEFSKLLFNAFNDNDHAYYYINKAVSHAPHKHYFKKLLYNIQDAYYKKNKDNNPSSKDSNPAQTDHKHQQQEQREIANRNDRNSGSRSGSTGFGFGSQYKDNYNDEDDYGVPDEDQDCAASIGKLSLSSNVFAGMNQKEIRPKTPLSEFAGDIDNNTNHSKQENENDKLQNNNEASLEIPLNPEIPEMENRFCATEFDRFISSDTLFGNEFEKYCDKFEDEGVNDIRWLLNENAMNEHFLQTKIKMNKESIILWKKNVNIFRNQYNIYIQWLQRNNFKRRYFLKFQVYGILNLESFFYYIKNREDVLYMIGDENKRDADFIWHSAQKEYEQTKDQIYL